MLAVSFSSASASASGEVGGGEIRHRIVGGDRGLRRRASFRRAITPLAARRSGCRPAVHERRVVARRVELLDGGAFVLAVEIAQRSWRRACRAACRQPADRRRQRCSRPSTGSGDGSAARLRAQARAAASSAAGVGCGGRGCGLDRLHPQAGRARLRLPLAQRSQAGRLVGLGTPSGGIGHGRGGVDLRSRSMSAAARRWRVRDAGPRPRWRVRRRCRGADALGQQPSVAETVRNVAATAIRTRSKPGTVAGRTVTHSSHLAPLGETAPAWNSSLWFPQLTA